MKTGSDGWLAGRLADAGAWPRAAVASGLAAAAATAAQVFCLAAALQGWMFDHLSLGRLAPWCAGFLASVALRVGFGWLKDEAGARASQRVRQRLRAELVQRVGALGPAWKAGQAAGDVVSRLQDQVDSLDAYVARYLPQRTLAVAAPLVTLAAVFAVNWVCGLLLVVTAPLVPLFMALIGLGARSVQTRQFQALSRMSGLFLDLLRGLPSLKLLGKAEEQTGRVEQASEEFRRRTMEVLRLAFLSSATLEFFSVLAIALTALYMGLNVLGLAFGPAANFQSALFVLLLAPEFFQPLRELGAFYHARAEAEAGAEQLRVFFEPSPTVAGGTRPVPPGPPALSVRQLSFSYSPAIPLLRGLSFEVPSGAALAVVGPSGSGKTSLLRLLLGVLRPDSGAVLVHGEPLETWDQEQWRSRIGWMGQHPRLLAAPLADNLRVACDASEEAMEEALDFAGLTGWFRRLPDRWDTRLGEGGRAMSGGELRRLALARLRLRPAELLLLDEPTASLDEALQEDVVRRLEELRRGRTLVVLTHRAGPLRLADAVLELSLPEEVR